MPVFRPAFAAGLALLAAVAAPAWAQATKAELFGAVRDAAGLPLARASLTLTHEETGATRAVATGSAGQWQFLALPPGAYRLHAEKAGFQTMDRTGIVLRVGDRLNLDLMLTLGEVRQTIEVPARAPLLQTTRSTVSYVAGRETVVALPLDGRSFIPLIALSAGVALPPNSVLPRINGSRPRTSEYIYDGISVLQPEPGQVAYFPVLDAIEEFRVEINSYSAEYGRSNGGVIMVNQKSGSNELHGSLFEFFRNEQLNARNYFATGTRQPVFRRNQYGFVLGGPVQKNRTFFFADWQGTRLATGVIRTSTVPLTTEAAGIYQTPVYDPLTTRQTPGGWARDPFPGNRIPPVRFDPAARRLLSRFPAPNVFVNGAEATANNYRRTGNNTTAQDQSDFRLDRYVGAAHRIFGRYTYLLDHSLPSAPLPDGSGNLTAGVIGDTRTTAGSLVLEHTWTLTPGAVNQGRFGYTRRGFDRGALRTGQPASAATGIPNIPLSSFSDAFPAFTLAGFQQIGPPPSGNAAFTTSVTQFLDSFSTIRGAHSLKLGADIRLEHLDVLQPPQPTGAFEFSPVLTAGLSAGGTPVGATGSSVASFALGQVQAFGIDLQPAALRPRAAIAEFFAQDDWLLNRRLTVNLGVRYTLNFPSTEANDRGAVFNLVTQRLDFLGKDGFPRSARNLEKGNFGPRAGLAWRANDRLVARAGYGLCWIEQAGITTPFTTPLFPFIRSQSQQSLDNIHPAFVLSQGPSVDRSEPGPGSSLGQGAFAVQRNQKSGYAQQWNFLLQHIFEGSWSLEAGYLGSKLTRLGVPDINLNQLRAEELAAGVSLAEPAGNPFYGQIPPSSSLGGPVLPRQQLLRSYPRFTTVTLYRNNTGNSTYHALQTHLERRFSQGLAFSLSYTFSRLIDDAGQVFDAAILTGPVAAYQVADSFNRRLEKDLSTGNIPHAISSGFVYQLPWGRSRRLSGWWGAFAGGWQMAGLVRAQSGSPVAVTQAVNLNAFAGYGIQRPNRIFDPTLPDGERSTGRWFDTSAFRAAPQFTIGNSSRNPVTAPRYFSADIMAGKTFTPTERMRIELRAEAFNLTNTPSFAAPNGSFGSPGFASITSAYDPRVFELVIKVHF